MPFVYFPLQNNVHLLNNLIDSPPEHEGNRLERDWYDKDIPLPDGIWDSDQDGDGHVDEDPPEKGTPIDDDMDNAKSSNDGLDNDHDGLIDEEDPDEGLNEDHLDDDGDWIDLNRNGLQEPMIWRDKDGDGQFGYDDVNDNGYYDTSDRFEFYDDEGNYFREYISGDYGIDEEFYDGIDNDGDTLIDEDLKGYRLLFNDATGITSQGTRIIAHGGHRSGEEGTKGGDPEGRARPSLAGHLVAIEARHDGRGFTGDVDEDRRRPFSPNV